MTTTNELDRNTDIKGSVVATLADHAHEIRLAHPPRPGLAAAIEQAVAYLRAAEALFSGGPDTPCRTVWDGEIECVSVPLTDLRAALASPVVAPSATDEGGGDRG